MHSTYIQQYHMIYKIIRAHTNTKQREDRSARKACQLQLSHKIDVHGASCST